jgi:hypothetical protein
MSSAKVIYGTPFGQPAAAQIPLATAQFLLARANGLDVLATALDELADALTAAADPARRNPDRARALRTRCDAAMLEILDAQRASCATRDAWPHGAGLAGKDDR